MALFYPKILHFKKTACTLDLIAKCSYLAQRIHARTTLPVPTTRLFTCAHVQKRTLVTTVNNSYFVPKALVRTTEPATISLIPKILNVNAKTDM